MGVSATGALSMPMPNYIISNVADTRQALRSRALAFVEEVLPDASEQTQCNVAQKITDALWRDIRASREAAILLQQLPK